jgi:hypothetical protein
VGVEEALSLLKRHGTHSLPAGGPFGYCVGMKWVNEQQGVLSKDGLRRVVFVETQKLFFTGSSFA